MGVHPFSDFETRTEMLVEARRDMWLWAEPIIADRAVEAYDISLDNKIAANIMARKHCRLWRAFLQDQPGDVPSASRELHLAGEKFGIEPKTMAEIDAAVLEELVDVVLCRYRTSRTAARTFSMVLMSATSSLGALRAAA